MIVSTTPSLEGHKIVRYVGVVNGEAIMGANIFKDLFASVRDIVGGRSGSYERELQKPATLLWKNCSNVLPNWAPMRWWRWIWIMRFWAKPTAC